MSTLIIKNARYIITCDDRDRLLERCNLFIRDHEIEYIGPADRQADQVIDASHMAVYPGLVSAHHHLFQTFSQNLPETQKMGLFSSLVTLYDVWQNLSEETLSFCSLAGLGALLKCGCTTCFDHHYVFPQNCGDLTAAQFRAAETVGIRFHASRGSMDLSRKNGGLPPDRIAGSIDGILCDSERLIHVWHDPERFSMRQIVLAPCSPMTASGDLLRETAALGRSLGVRLHTQAAVSADEEQYLLDRYGMRPLAYLDSLGWTGPDVWLAHGVRLNDGELGLLAATGTGIAHCPVSDMRFACGVCRIGDMLSLGVPVGLASDGSDPLEALRIAYLLHRSQGIAHAPGGYQLLKAATRGSARLLGRNDIGALAAGMAADLFMVNLDRFELAGAQADPMSLPAASGFRGPVDYTIVNGVPVVQQGQLVTADEAELSARANEAAYRYLNRF